jgi:hypothetical protein
MGNKAIKAAVEKALSDAFDNGLASAMKEKFSADYIVIEDNLRRMDNGELSAEEELFIETWGSGFALAIQIATEYINP